MRSQHCTESGFSCGLQALAFGTEMSAGRGGGAAGSRQLSKVATVTSAGAECVGWDG